MPENPESAVLRAIAELEAEESAAHAEPIADGPPWRYGADYQFGPGAKFGWIDHRGQLLVPMQPAPQPHTPGVLGLIRDALVALGRWLR